MFIKNAVCSLIFICLYSMNLFAQSDSNYFYVGEFNITQKENGKLVSYNFKDKNFVFINNDTVRVSPSKYKYSISIGDIRKIGFIHHGTSGAVLGYSFLAGAVLGLLGANIALNDGPGGSLGGSLAGAFGGGVIFAVIGVGISSIFSHDVNYDLTKLSIDKKRAMLREVLNSNRF